jgi:copper(I)-binding protein
MKTRGWKPLVLAIVVMGLAACGGAGQRDVIEKPGMAVAKGRLILPAVAGNPGAAYFNIFNGNDVEVSVVAAAIEGAGKAEMYDTKGMSTGKIDALSIKPTWTERFNPGWRQVTAFDLDPKLAPGDETLMMLTFADGDKMSVPLAVKAAGSEEED